MNEPLSLADLLEQKRVKAADDLLRRNCEARAIAEAQHIEPTIRVCLKPRPRWIPKRLYWWAVRNLIELRQERTW